MHLRKLLPPVALFATALWLLLLAAQDTLTLFAHPRYQLFTVLTAAALLLLSLWRLWRLACDRSSGISVAEEHGHDSRFTLAPFAFGGLLLAVVLVAPASVTGLADHLETVPAAAGADLPFGDADYTAWTFKEWHALLTSDAPFPDTGEVVLSGVVVTGSDEQEFYLTRYRMYCCAVDLTPLPIPVEAPEWQERFKPGDWVQVTGTFEPTPSLIYQRVLRASAVESAPVPGDPYEY
jgi:uncharacterized repeat protein (TIGR03943 family)